MGSQLTYCQSLVTRDRSLWMWPERLSDSSLNPLCLSAPSHTQPSSAMSLCHAVLLWSQPARNWNLSQNTLFPFKFQAPGFWFSNQKLAKAHSLICILNIWTGLYIYKPKPKRYTYIIHFSLVRNSVLHKCLEVEILCVTCTRKCTCYILIDSVKSPSRRVVWFYFL